MKKQLALVLCVSALGACSSPDFKSKAASKNAVADPNAQNQNDPAQGNQSDDANGANGVEADGNAGGAGNGTGSGSTTGTVGTSNLPGGGGGTVPPPPPPKVTIALTNCTTKLNADQSAAPGNFCTAPNQVLVEINDQSSTFTVSGSLAPAVPTWKVGFGCCEVAASNNASVQSRYEVPNGTPYGSSTAGIKGLALGNSCPENSFVGVLNEAWGSMFVCKSFSANAKSIFYKKIGSQPIQSETTDSRCPSNHAMAAIGVATSPGAAPYRGSKKTCFELDIQQ